MAKVRKRGDSWQVDYRVAGRRRFKTFETKREALEYCKRVEYRKQDPSLRKVSVEATSLKGAINKYFELVTSKKAPKTIMLEKLGFEKMWKYLGNPLIHELSLVDLEEFQAHLLKSVKPASVNRSFNFYRNFFQKCIDWGFILDTPTARLKNLKIDVKLRQTWMDEDLQRVLESAAPWASDAFFMIASSGIRAGECANLRWCEVDLKEKVFYVLAKKGTGQGHVRAIPIVGEMEGLFKRRYDEAQRHWRARPSDHVFLNASGNPVTSTHLSREMQRLCQKLGLKGHNLHGLRHTFISRLAAQDHSLEKIRLLVGHSNLKTTQNYLHLHCGHLRKTMEEASADRKVVPIYRASTE